MSIVMYNGVTLAYCLTKAFNQEVVTDPSGIDRIGTRFYIVVECVWNQGIFPIEEGEAAGNPLSWQIPDALRTTGQDVRGRKPAVAMSGVKYPYNEHGLRTRLLEERKQFAYFDDDYSPILICPQNTMTGLTSAPPTGPNLIAQTDDRFGPWPRHLNIIRMGSTTAVIEFAIECVQLECTQGTIDDAKDADKAKGYILSNRWKGSMHIDRNCLQTRTHTGRLIVRGSAIPITSPTAPPSADEFRGWVFPPLPSGFVRDAIDITLTESGLELDYTIIDKQEPRPLDPSGPAVKAKAIYTERTSNPSGATVDANISIELEGRPDSDPRDLLTLAAQIVLSRLGVKRDAAGFPDPRGNKGLIGILSNAQIEEDLFFPRLKMQVAIRKAFSTPGVTAKPGEDADKKTDKKDVIAFGLDFTRIGLSPFIPTRGRPVVPGTVDPRFYSGASPGDFGVPNSSDMPGIRLFAQILRCPCCTLAGPINRPEVQEAVISASPESIAIIPDDDQIQNEPQLLPPGRINASGKYGLQGDPQPPPSTGAGGSFGDVDATLEAYFIALDQDLTNYTVSFKEELPGQGPVDPDDFDGTVYSLEDFGNLYTDYKIDTTYEWNGHTLQVPRTGQSTLPCRYIRTSQRTCTKVVQWTCERVGEPPQLPSIDTGDSNDVYLDKKIIPAAPEAAPDGVNMVYRVSGVYYYGLKVPPAEGAALPTGALPNLRGNALRENTLPGANYQSDILNPNAAPPRLTAGATTNPATPGSNV